MYWPGGVAVNKYLYIFFFLLILSISPAFAAESGSLGENYTVWADITNGTTYYNATSANLTIFNAERAIIYDDVAMSSVENTTGRYYFVYSPQSIGQHYGSVEYYNGDTLLITSSDSWTIKDDNMNFLSLVIGFVGLTFLLFYASNSIKSEKLPKGRFAEKIFLYFFGVINLLFLFFILWAQSTQSSSLDIFSSLLESHFILALIILVIVMFSFIGYMMYQYFTKAVKEVMK